MIDNARLLGKILYLGADDWVPLGEASYYAGMLVSDATARRRLLLVTLRQLLDDGLVEPGRIDSDPATSADFVPWTGSTEEKLARLAMLYTPDVSDEDAWYYSCWLKNTAAGTAAEATLPAGQTECMTR